MARLLDANGRELPPTTTSCAKKFVKRKLAKFIQADPYTAQMVSDWHDTEKLLAIYQTVKYLHTTKDAKLKHMDAEIADMYKLLEQVGYLQTVIDRVDAGLDKLKDSPLTVESYAVIQKHYLSARIRNRNYKKDKKLKRAIRDLDRVLWEEDGKES